MLKDIWDSKKKELITAVAALGSVITIFTGVTFIEDRYVHASDFKEYAEQQQQSIKEFRIQDLEDKIFELEFKQQSGTATALDNALKERYRQQLNRLK